MVRKILRILGASDRAPSCIYNFRFTKSQLEKYLNFNSLKLFDIDRRRRFDLSDDIDECIYCKDFESNAILI